MRKTHDRKISIVVLQREIIKIIGFFKKIDNDVYADDGHQNNAKLFEDLPGDVSLNDGHKRLLMDITRKFILRLA